jgi:hypothetical protein
VALLAARSPKLPRALAQAKNAGHAYVVVDGTLIPIDRVAADRLFYSGKHRHHGMNLQVISAPTDRQDRSTHIPDHGRRYTASYFPTHHQLGSPVVPLIRRRARTTVQVAER